MCAPEITLPSQVLTYGRLGREHPTSCFQVGQVCGRVIRAVLTEPSPALRDTVDILLGQGHLLTFRIPPGTFQ